MSVLLAVLAAAANAVSSVLQRVANAREVGRRRVGPGRLFDLLRQPVWLAGIAAAAAGGALQAGALSVGRLSQVQPLLAMELPLTLLLASRLFRLVLTRRDWTAIVAMAAGTALFLFALDPSRGATAGPGAVAWLLGAGGTAAMAALLTLAAWLGRDGPRAALLGAAAGTGFALTAAFLSGALRNGLSWIVLAHWQLYLAVATGLVALLLLQLGMQTGTLVAVQPGVTLVDPAVAILLGALLFGERLRLGGWLLLEVPCAMLIGWGAVLLSRSPVAAAGPTASSAEQHRADLPAVARRWGPPW